MIRVEQGDGSKALVTLVVGDEVRASWERHAREGWERWARRHGYDLLAFDEPLDDSPRAAARSPSWQKCLIPSHPDVRRYARLAWVDADVLINPTAPCLAAQVPAGKVGGTDAYAFLSRDLHDHLYDEYLAWSRGRGGAPVECRTPRDYYRAFGLEDPPDEVLQCGVLVLEPRLHAELLAGVYARHEERRDPATGYAYNLEMRPLSWELVRRGLHHFVDQRWNLILSNWLYLTAPWLFHGDHEPAARRRAASLAVTAAYAHAWFLHFAGGLWRDHLELLLPGVERPADFARVAP